MPGEKYFAKLRNFHLQKTDIKGKYYHETDYYEKTYEMLRKFSEEFEVFASKYIR